MEQTCKTPWRDLQKSALEHYKELSSKAHHWMSFIPAAIKAYAEEDRGKDIYTIKNEPDATSL